MSDVGPPEPYVIAVARAMAAVSAFLDQRDSTGRFTRATHALDDALTLGLLLAGAEPKPGPAIVAQLRSQYAPHDDACTHASMPTSTPKRQEPQWVY